MPNPARILIIDDIAANLVLLGEVLSDLAEVQFATSGTEALALVQQSQPDLILLDVMMPEMDGYAVCEVLKSGPASRAIPLIFVTAKNDPQSESRALEAGAADFIHKPINHTVVRARVRLQLELKGRELALQRLNAELENTVALRTHALSDALAGAQDAERIKSAFLANMSHEIRTPLNAIIGMTHLAQGTELTARQRNYLGRIESASQHLMGIINGILDLTKIQAGKLQAEVSDFELEQLLDNTIAMVAAKAADKGLELILSVAPGTPAYLRGDPLRLGQVLLNFASNAVKFTEQGEVEISVVASQVMAHSAHLRFAVRDTGIGISDAQRGALFKDFSQADSSTTRKYGGTGLGLAIAARLVDLMGGEYGLASSAAVGSTFWFAVPLGLQTDAPAAPQMPADAAGFRILVVDDNASARRQLCDMLGRMNFSVESAGTGADALLALQAAQACQQPPDVVLLDWQLPDMSGAALARQIRQTPLGRQPHLSLLTAFGREHLFAAATLDGINSMLGKPVSGSALFEHMMSVLGRSAFQSVPAESVAGEPDALLDLRALRGRRVLLVEDNAINRELGLELLQEQGLRVVTAEHGQQALELLRAGLHFDLVLMDIQMPVLDGLAATRAIRALPGFAELPILAMTANAMSEDRQRCLDAGMNDFVTKPIDIKALWRALLRWLPYRSGPGKRPADPPGAAQPSELSLALAGPVEGLDTDLGLRRCLGRPDLYLRLLRQFAEGQDQEARQLQVALEQSNWLVAQRLAHTLKSVAANLGALRLQALADSLERALAAQAPGPPDTQHLLAQGQQVDLATRHLLQQLALALGPAPRYRPVADAPAIAARLPAPGAIAAPLRELLARGDFDALALVVSQANPLRQAMGTQFEPFERALAAFDFDRAIALLDSTHPQPAAPV